MLNIICQLGARQDVFPLGLEKTISTFILLFVFSITAHAAVLPEDRVDVLYHSFDGGGVTIDGPSVLVRKSFDEKVSVYANYYVDMVSSASIDVEATASRYSEKRTEYRVGFDYLNDKTVWSFGYTNSRENDYDADTFSLAVSQDFFGDLTTVSLSFAYGDDEVRQNDNDQFIPQKTEHRRYGLGISQILTKNLIVALNFETVVDEGFLNNPYRTVRFLDPANPGTVGREAELYPRTRNSDTVALRAKYFLPYRAAIHLEGRSFSDSFGIDANSFEFRYTQPIDDTNWTLEGKLRAYKQDQADFYSDLFPFANLNGVEFRARDKELSDYTTRTIGIGASYQFERDFLPFFNKSTINLYWDYIKFDYDNFLDETKAGGAGNEPAYSFDANVIRFFISGWF